APRCRVVADVLHARDAVRCTACCSLHPPTTELYTLSLHDALPILEAVVEAPRRPQGEHERHEGPFDVAGADGHHDERGARERKRDRKSTRLNSSHQITSYAVFCLKKKNKDQRPQAERGTAETGNAT